MLSVKSSTKAHELAHWTAHPSRLARVPSKRFGDNAYAAEELVVAAQTRFNSCIVGEFAKITLETRERENSSTPGMGHSNKSCPVRLVDTVGRLVTAEQSLEHGLANGMRFRGSNRSICKAMLLP